MKKILFLIALLSTTLFSSVQSNNSIVIYPNNLALFNEYKIISDIKIGENSYLYPNVSSSFISDSVSLFLPSEISILEQNYKFDIINQYNLLLVNVNKLVDFYETDTFDSAKIKLQTGKILSVENNFCMIQTDDGIRNIPFNKIIISSIPEGMITKPSLLFRLKSKKEFKNLDVNLRYLSNGFSWKSNYIASLDKNNKMNIIAWITLTNNSNISLKNYNLTLLAGEVNKVRHKPVYRLYKSKSIAINNNMEDIQVKEKAFSGYHIYEVPFLVDIPKKSQKQISFFNKNVQNISFLYKQKISYVNSSSSFRFNQYISFKNTEFNGLGIPFPAGIIRFFKENNEGKKAFFIGENSLKDTPKNETLNIKIGKDFDSAGHIFLNKKIHNKYRQFYSYNYEFNNYSNQKKHFIIEQYIPINKNGYNGDFEVDSSCNSNNSCSYKLINDKTIQYDFLIKKEGNLKFSSSFDYH